MFQLLLLLLLLEITILLESVSGLLFYSRTLPMCLQCYDIVGWASGRASGL